ncbi:GFA family protein [Acidimangrovimonas pyrenivorans]|uniref:GFA family protein n=1 Tax=Acidimangrovimonas pyrenivorans TaxID=2030798 RepID=A0ABV7AH09_9RHOB
MIGHCTCGHVKYRLKGRPLFTHCCHCTWCQRETGSAFALNALIESDRIELITGRPERIETPSASGKGQTIARCPYCHVALWSHYAGGGAALAFVRVGTLGDPAECPPDIHIFTSTKLPWVILPGNVPAVPEYYRRSEMWPAASLERWAALKAKG